MPPVLPHFSPPSDAMAAVPLDPARLGSTGPSSLVMRTGMLVPAVWGHGGTWSLAGRGDGVVAERREGVAVELGEVVVMGKWKGMMVGMGEGVVVDGVVEGMGEGVVVGRKGVRVSRLSD